MGITGVMSESPIEKMIALGAAREGLQMLELGKKKGGRCRWEGDISVPSEGFKALLSVCCCFVHSCYKWKDWIPT